MTTDRFVSLGVPGYFFYYESWLEPVLAPDRQHDVTASVQVTWYPDIEAKRPYKWKPR